MIVSKGDDPEREAYSGFQAGGIDLAAPGGMVSVNGTSELPMRNQFAAWKQFMVAGAEQEVA